MKWYAKNIGDWDTATSHLTSAEYEVYDRLLMYYYGTTEGPFQAIDPARDQVGAQANGSANGIANDVANIERLASVCRATTPEKRAAIPKILAEFFPIIDGFHTNVKADFEIRKALRISTKRRAAAHAGVEAKRAAASVDKGVDKSQANAGNNQQSTDNTNSKTKPIVGRRAPDDGPEPECDPQGTNPRDVKKQAANAIAVRVLTHLNKRTGTKFRPLESNVKLIRARVLYDGATEEQLVAVIDMKAEQVRAGEFGMQFMRPATLFNAEKWAQYSGQLGMQASIAAAAPTTAQVMIYAKGANGHDVPLFGAAAPLKNGKLDALAIAKRIWEKGQSAIKSKFRDPSDPPRTLIVESLSDGSRSTFAVAELS